MQIRAFSSEGSSASRDKNAKKRKSRAFHSSIIRYFFLPVLIVVVAVFAGDVWAASKSYQFPNARLALKIGHEPDFATVRNNCTICHSDDYINYQPRGKGKAFWEAEVQKMIKIYRAPIQETDARIIVDYLTKLY